MTETSSASIPSSNDTISVLPILSDNRAPLSLTLTIDKSVSKLASWALVLIIMLSVVVGAAVMAMSWMIYEWRDAKREARLVEYYMTDPDHRSQQDIESWSKYRNEHEDRK